MSVGPPKMEPGIIYCETSIGSREFEPILARRHGIRSALAHFRAGDFSFRCGHTKPTPFCEGDYGCKLTIERKTLSDCVGSLLKRRIDKQVTEMLEDYDMAWIVVEGIWRPGPDDCIQVIGRKGWEQSRFSLSYSQLSSWLVRYDVMGRGRLHRWRTSSISETAAFISSTWRWWQKEWDKHHVESVSKMPAPMKALMWSPLQIHRTAASLPEVGIQGAKKVGKHFKSIKQMINAPVSEWVAALRGDGDRDLKKDAATIVAAIEKEYR